MTGMSEPIAALAAAVAEERRDLSVRIRRSAEYVVIPLFALAASVVLFSVSSSRLGNRRSHFSPLSSAAVSAPASRCGTPCSDRRR